MKTIDGLNFEEVKYNVYAFGQDAKMYARKRDAARYDHTRAKWQKKYANAAGYLANNQERLAEFEAIQKTCAHVWRNVTNGEYFVVKQVCDICGAIAQSSPASARQG